MNPPVKVKPPGQVTLKDVRFAYVHADAPWAKKGDDPDKAKYGLTVLIDKKHPQLPSLQEAIQRVTAIKWGEDHRAKGIKPISCLHDGSEKDHKDGFDSSLMYFNASRRPSDGPPQVRNMQGLIINAKASPDEFPYSGCYGHVIVNLWAQDNKDGKRINAELIVVIKTKGGERFGGSGIDADAAAAELLGLETVDTGAGTVAVEDEDDML